MKILNLLKSAVIALCFLNISTAFSQATENIVAEPYYTSVDYIVLLDIGNTYEEVVDKLKSQPTAVINNNNNGLVVEFKYLLKSKKIKSSNKTNSFNVFNKAKDHYNIEKSLYMFFDYNKKLKSYYTDTGTQSSADVLTWENTFNKLDCENCSIGTVE
jgi:hypothetical protein